MEFKKIEIVNRSYLDEVDPEYSDALVICDDDNKLEGIITEGEKDYLVFGAIDEDRIFLVQGLTADIGYTMIYRGIKEDDLYLGNQFAKNEFMEIGAKEAYIKIKDKKDLTVEEITELKEKIKEKSKGLNKASTELYNERFKKEEVKRLLYSKK